jgi:alpha-D-ribose 1-methylphosphonate 5-triphosphate synthase subunit PhnH
MSLTTDNNGAAAYRGGFGNPVLQGQGVFRIVMDAMARPGTIRSLEPAIAGVKPPSPLCVAAGVVALTLCDADTSIWLTSALRQSAAKAWVGFHTGAPFTEQRGESRFAFVEKGGVVPGFGQFALGTQEYPDRSTTLVLEIEALSGGMFMTASGPGIRDAIEFSPRGLPDVFPALWAENRALFPRGVDLILVAGTDIVCLPRTTKLERREG